MDAPATDVAPAALGIGLFTVDRLAAAEALRCRAAPHMLLALLAATVLAYGSIAGRSRAPARIAVVGPIPAIWPHLTLPVVDLRALPDLVGIAFALTIVALGQSISIAKAVATRSGQHIDANREFRGQGLSNIVGGLFSSYVSCGSLNRSFPNLEAGARTPLAAVFASLWLLLLAAISAPLLALIPMPAIAALLLLISWSLFDWPSWRQLWRFSRQDFAVAAATFVATISIRLEVAILLGTILSLVTYLYRTSKPAIRIMGFDGTGAGAAVRRAQRRARAAAGVPAAEDDPDGRRGLLRRGLARERPAARPARAGALAQAPAGDVARA